MEITVDYLEEWENENEEDVFMDGPFYFNLDQWEELGELIYQKFNQKYNTNHQFNENWEDSMFDDDLGWNIFDSSGKRLALEALAEIINKYDIEEV